MMIIRWASRALIALLVTCACGYFLWVEIPQFLFFKSTPGLIEYVEPVCFLSSEGQSSATDCAAVRARAGNKRVNQMYRATIRYQSPADDREHVETIVTRALGPVRNGATWKLLAHTAEANRVQPVNNGGRAILFGVVVLGFVIWLRASLNRFVRRAIQGPGRSSLAAGGPLGAQKLLLGAIALAVFLIFFRSIQP